MTDENKLGRKVREARVKMQKTQTCLAKEIGRSPQLICDIEAGRKLPSTPTLSALATALNISTDEMLLP